MDMHMRPPRPMPIGPNVPLMAQLEAQEWGIAIRALSKLPYEVVATIITKLSEQLTGQQQPAAETPPQPPQE